MEMREKIATALAGEFVSRPSVFQMRHWIVGREYTNQGKMWQCLRELHSRRSWFDQYDAETEEAKDRLELLHIEKEKVRLSFYRSKFDDERSRELGMQEVQIRHRQIDRQIASVEKTISELKTKHADCEFEANFYMSELERLKAVEPLRPLDDEESQTEYWSTKLFHELNLSMLLHRPMDPEHVKMVLAMGDDSPLKRKMVGILHENAKMLSRGTGGD